MSGIDSAKPVIKEVIATRKKISITITKENYEGLAVFKSTDGTLFKQTGTIETDCYEDQTENKKPQPETRFYKFCFLKDDKTIGLESKVVKVVAEIY